MTPAQLAARVDRIRTLAASGISLHAIARSLSCDAHSVTRTATRYGIAVRADDAPAEYRPVAPLHVRLAREEGGPATSAPSATPSSPALILDRRPDRWRGGPRVRLGLAGDVLSVQLGVERRRWDCTRLWGCEAAWIAEHGAQQGRCPVGCAWYGGEVRRKA